MTSLAVDEIAALELLKQRGANTRAAGAAGIAHHPGHRNVLPLFENSIEVALEPLVQGALDTADTRLELLDFDTEIAEGMLPGVVGGVPARFELRAPGATLIEIFLQRLDLTHRLERGVFL